MAQYNFVVVTNKIFNLVEMKKKVSSKLGIFGVKVKDIIKAKQQKQQQQQQ